MPKRQETLSCFIQTSKYFFFCSILPQGYFTSGQCYQGNISLLQYLSFHTMKQFRDGQSSVCSTKHKVRIYKEYHSVCPLVRIGTLTTPLSPASVPLPPQPGGGGVAHSPAGEGLGESQFRRPEKKLSTLPTLWYEIKRPRHTYFHLFLYSRPKQQFPVAAPQFRGSFP
jgi:hypothetical protein